MAQHASDLIQDLGNVPNIIGGLGLSIASAQKAFDADYLDRVERILAMVKSTLGVSFTGPDGKPFPEAIAFLQDLIARLAPPRYQYSETTFTVRLDLAQSMKTAGSVGLGFGIGAVSVNAAFTLGYGYDYRAAAECKTVIHAYPADQTVFNALLGRAASLNDKALELPPRSQVDQMLFDKNAAIFEKISGQKTLPVVTRPVITAIDPASPRTGPVTILASGIAPGSTVTFTDSAGVSTAGIAAIGTPTTTALGFQLPANAPAGASSIEIVTPEGVHSERFTFPIAAA